VKKILVICLAVVSIAIAAVWAAAPVAITTASVKAADTVTNTKYYGGTWKNITNCIYGLTDSATVVMTFSGVAVGNPGSKVYLGFSTDSAGVTAGPTLDTIILEFPSIRRAGGMVRVPFSFNFATTYVSQTDIVDTIYMKAATGGTSQSDVVYFEDVALIIAVGDKSAAYN
jgi:hypothetical protein